MNLNAIDQLKQQPVLRNSKKL